MQQKWHRREENLCRSVVTADFVNEHNIFSAFRNRNLRSTVFGFTDHAIVRICQNKTSRKAEEKGDAEALRRGKQASCFVMSHLLISSSHQKRRWKLGNYLRDDDGRGRRLGNWNIGQSNASNCLKFVDSLCFVFSLRPPRGLDTSRQWGPAAHYRRSLMTTVWFLDSHSECCAAYFVRPLLSRHNQWHVIKKLIYRKRAAEWPREKKLEKWFLY